MPILIGEQQLLCFVADPCVLLCFAVASQPASSVMVSCLLIRRTRLPPEIILHNLCLTSKFIDQQSFGSKTMPAISIGEQQSLCFVADPCVLLCFDVASQPAS